MTQALRQANKVLQGVPIGYWPFAIANGSSRHTRILVLAQTDAHAQDLQKSISLIRPDFETLYFPSHPSSPYESLGNMVKTQSLRNLCFKRILEAPQQKMVLITTLAGLSLRCPPQSAIRIHEFEIAHANHLKLEQYIDRLTDFGYLRVDTVRDRGEFSVRGGLLDIFPVQSDTPYRIDYFDQDIESIWIFDPLTQLRETKVTLCRVQAKEQGWALEQQKEVFLKRFRERFGDDSHNHRLYKALRDGKTPVDLDFWTSLFFQETTSIVAMFAPTHFVGDADVVNQYSHYYQNLCAAFDFHTTTNPESYILPPHEVYIEPEEITKTLEAVQDKALMSPLVAQKDTTPIAVSAFKFWTDHSKDVLAPQTNKKIEQWAYLAKTTSHQLHFCCQTKGDVVELLDTLNNMGLHAEEKSLWCPQSKPAICVYLWPSQPSVVFEHNIVLSTDDFFQRNNKQRKKSSELFIAEATSLAEGDLVVHEEHGVGQFTKLVTIQIDGAAHDCLCLVYDGGDRLYVPVENLDVLTRYGQSENGSGLDKLGSSSWQQRKAKVKKDLLAMAEGLLRIAALRKEIKAEAFPSDDPLYSEFVQRFPFQPTADQLSAFEDVETDLASGNLMDRLICGDVGFGKTEVALRAACLVAAQGKQVAVVVPTTLLARQHMANFSNRFAGLGLNIAMLSRFTKTQESKAIKTGLAEGKVNIVIGTHGLLHANIKFLDLGLVIIDEEQHFGVKQKEQLKNLKADVHVLTLSATPIPRTLQMSLSGVKELSIIATPPLQRLAVLTQVTPSEGSLIREALLREKNRQGLSFYVCPRINDLENVRERLSKIVPELHVVTAHGQMPIDELEAVMDDFYNGKADILLATNIIESGLDISRANTLIIHRADLFGLAQLYQLRGRVGRGSTQGYAYLTVPTDKAITPSAQKRLEVMQSLDSLGAGFQLASYDLDIRGAGNILGQEQSGHIREIGVELYQTMLQEAVASVTRDDSRTRADDNQPFGHIAPQIHIGIPVFIPEEYIPDLSVRLEFYKRSAIAESEDSLRQMRVEMIDRFGPIPQEVSNLFEVIQLKQVCKSLHIESLVVGDRGMVIKFYNKQAPRPDRLILLIQQKQATWKVRPDQSLAITQLWANNKDKIAGVKEVLHLLKQELVEEQA